MPSFAALVPMRHHSQRVPGKNYRQLAGKPLFHHIVQSLLAVPEINEIVVDTDSEPVMDGVREHFRRLSSSTVRNIYAQMTFL
jgi:CMP-N-acetylneuraminic acid synthetase